MDTLYATQGLLPHLDDVDFAAMSELYRILQGMFYGTVWGKAGRAGHPMRCWTTCMLSRTAQCCWVNFWPCSVIGMNRSI